MGKYLYTRNSKEKLRLSMKPFAGGGEGNLYKIVSPSSKQEYVAKVYHPAKQTAIREAKLLYMLENAPASTQFQEGKSDSRLVWVVDLLYNDKNEFVGFIMPMIEGEKLEILCTPQLPKKINPIWERFNLNNPKAEGLRLKVCFNLAAAVHQLHATQQYILVDLKPDNVIIQPNGVIWLVDIDSIEIVKNGQKLYDAPVATPEYTPPEHYNKKLKYDPTSFVAWDQFSLAVILYKLLFGIHPYAASCMAPYDKATNLAQKIELGLFVYNSSLQDYFQAIPDLHKEFRKLNHKLQALFVQCFVEGHQKTAARPRADQWCSALMQLLDLTVKQPMPSELFKMPVNLAHNVPILSTPPPDSPKTKLPTARHSFMFRQHQLKQFQSSLAQTFWVKGLILASCISIVGGIYFLMTKGVFLFLITAALLFGIAIYLAKISLPYRKEFAEREQFKRLAARAKEKYEQGRNKVYGIQNYLHEFYMNLQQDHAQLIRYLKSRVEENQHHYKAKLDELYKVLILKDKEVEVILDYEKVEYQTLVDKYDKELRINSLFHDAKSLDEELSKVRFGKVESAQLAINEVEETELINQQKEIEAALKKIDEKEEAIEKEIRTELAHLKASIDKKEEAEFKLQQKRIQSKVDYEMGNVDLYANQYLLSFKEPILAFLTSNGIEQIDDIQQINPTGEVVLKSGKKYAIAPLKYYQIHDLVKWWIDLRAQQHSELPVDMERMISEKYYEKYLKERQRLLKELKEELSHLGQQRKDLYKQYNLSMKMLTEKYEQEAKRIERKYKEGLSILEKLHQKRLNEEQAIHQQYQKQYQEIIKDASQYANNVKQEALKLATVKLTEEQQEQYTLLQKNMEVFHAARKRLDEEKINLEDLILYYENEKKLEQSYKDINFSNHFWNMIFE